jgi:hypothetical protein
MYKILVETPNVRNHMAFLKVDLGIILKYNLVLIKGFVRIRAGFM